MKEKIFEFAGPNGAADTTVTVRSEKYGLNDDKETIALLMYATAGAVENYAAKSKDPLSVRRIAALVFASSLRLATLCDNPTAESLKTLLNIYGIQPREG